MENAVLIKVDRQTHARLKGLAGETPLARYLRELTISMSGGPAVPLSSVEKKLESIESNLRSFQDQLFSVSRIDLSGNVVPVYCIKNPDAPGYFSLIDSMQLREADEKHPGGELDCFFYHRDCNGVWHLIKERVERDYKLDDEDRDAIFAYYDYFNSLTPVKQRALEKKLFPSRDFGKNHQVMIDFGKKLLAEKESGDNK